MRKRLAALLVCLMLFAALPVCAYAGMLETPLKPEADSLAGAAAAHDRDKILAILKKGIDSYGVVVDMDNFNVIVFAPADPQMYYQMPDMENRVLTSMFIDPNADAKTAVEKERRAFYYDSADCGFKGSYTAMAVNTANLKLPERVPSEMDTILDSALFVRESGFYDLNNSVCTGCGTYVRDGELKNHCVLDCGVHMSCYHDPNDINHYTRCVECGRMKCSCYCNSYLSFKLLVTVSGGKEYAVGGVFHDNVHLAFEKGVKVSCFGDIKESDLIETTPSVDCSGCGKSVSMPWTDNHNCGVHFFCGDCEKKLTAKQLNEHSELLECGHYACDGKKHSDEIYSLNCPNYTKHHKCEGYSNVHHCETCGNDFTCEEGLEHADCLICGGKWCDGRFHGQGNCG